MRLLTSLLPTDQAAPDQRKGYLRKMIQGSDVDHFALEIARLSLTLTDIPNANGWNLVQGDAFASDLIETASAKARILLANPPFEPFKPEDRQHYSKAYREPTFMSKAAEMLHRSVTALPAGGVFGLVVPQNLLHRKNANAFRQLLSNSTEFDEIALFPDQVFNVADVESAILIGQKVACRSDASKAVRYRRVRDGGMDQFRIDYSTSSDVTVTQERFQNSESHDLRVPDLEEIWACCANMPKLGDVAEIGQGFSFIGKDSPKFPKGQKRTSPVPRKGFVEGFENLGTNVLTHQLPPTTYLNLSPEIVRVALAGTTVGKAQVLLNEARLQRAPWCLAAMMDEEGHPVTTPFTTLRSSSESISLLVLWAVLNSPVANSFGFTHMSGWHILTGMLRNFRIPRDLINSPCSLESAASAYLAAVHAFENKFILQNDEAHEAEREALRILHWRMDAEVLKLYALPPELERKLLDYFAGCKRVGVPFHQDRYFPEHYDEPISLADYLAITVDWEQTNQQRLALIDKKLNRTITADESRELARLKRLARAMAQLVRPLPLKELKAEEAELKRRGLWQEA